MADYDWKYPKSDLQSLKIMEKVGNATLRRKRDIDTAKWDYKLTD